MCWFVAVVCVYGFFSHPHFCCSVCVCCCFLLLHTHIFASLAFSQFHNKISKRAIQLNAYYSSVRFCCLHLRFSVGLFCFIHYSCAKRDVFVITSTIFHELAANLAYTRNVVCLASERNYGSKSQKCSALNRKAQFLLRNRSLKTLPFNQVSGW